jgi:hypothetical protein
MNPHNVPVQRFALKAEKKDEAIFCYSNCGPHFDGIAVSDNCNANTPSYTSCFGNSYTNDTGMHSYTFFTGSVHFQVKEIEVFEITDDTSLPPNRASVLFPKSRQGRVIFCSLKSSKDAEMYPLRRS